MGCQELTDLRIPSGVTEIGAGAFTNCSFETIQLPDGLETIESGVFSGCYSLTRIDIPSKVLSIGDNAFSGTRLKSIKFPENLKKIGNEAFVGCSDLQTIIIPGKVESLGWHIFMNCNLDEVIISEGVKNIGGSAFYDAGIKKIHLPSTLEAIYAGALDDCKFEEIYCAATTPPEVYSSNFESSIYHTCRIYIPKGSIDLYKKADYWKKFVVFVEKDF